MISFSDEPALPKKHLKRKVWTDSDVSTLMVMADKHTSQGKRIRWREISYVLDREPTSCAVKYHTVRSLAAGRIARDLIDADLAARDPVKHAGAYPKWSAEEDAKLLAACKGNIIRGEASWVKIAEGFPGRSFYAVRQRYLTLRNQIAGVVRDRDRKSRPIVPRKRAPVVARFQPVPASRAAHKTLTSALLGDPLPGRSALDRKRAGIVDEVVVDHRNASILNRPKITLPEVPFG